MIISQSNLDVLFTGFKASYAAGFASAKPMKDRVAMTVPSGTSEEIYPWLGQLPKMREWLGDRVIRGIIAHSFKIKNLSFESTISVPRTKIEDDQYGTFGKVLEEMGRSAAEHPDEMVFGLLGAGFNTACYDGQYFFDTDHPVSDGEAAPVSVSNYQAGAGEAWYLLDCSRLIKPLIYQERLPYELAQMVNPSDYRVFVNDEFLYGVRARANVGFGLWQLAYASKAELNADNYEAARAAMSNMKGDGGRPLNIRPDTLVVSPNLEGAAKRLLNNGTRVISVNDGNNVAQPVPVQNEWAGTAEIVVSSWLNA